MSARRVTAKPSVVPDWRQTFVEELGVLAFGVGIPRATVRILAWLVVCDPPEQSAPEIQSALQLSAGAVGAAARTLIGIGMLERPRTRVTGTCTTRCVPEGGTWHCVAAVPS